MSATKAKAQKSGAKIGQREPGYTTTSRELAQRRAGNSELSFRERLHWLARGRANAIGHAEFEPGELSRVAKIDRRSLPKAIRQAVAVEYLDPDSSARCLVLPEGDQQALGDSHCRHHQMGRCAVAEVPKPSPGLFTKPAQEPAAAVQAAAPAATEPDPWAGAGFSWSQPAEQEPQPAMATAAPNSSGSGRKAKRSGQGRMHADPSTLKPYEPEYTGVAPPAWLREEAAERDRQATVA